jgi:hypothetical protein
MSDTVTTTQLCKHFGVQFRPEVLIEAGVEPVSKVKNGYNWRVSDVPAIADAVIEHVGDRRSKPLDLSAAPTKAEKKAVSTKVKEQAHDPLNDDDDDDDDDESL